MKRLYVWGMVAWSTAWLFLAPNLDPSPFTFWWLAAIGTFLILAAAFFDPIEARPWHPRVLLAAIGLLIFGWWWFDLPFLGPLLLAAGAIAMVALGRADWGRRLAGGLLTVGSVAMVQLIGYYIFIVYLGPRGHGCAIPASLIAAALRLFGIQAAALEDGLHLLAVDRLYQVVPSPNNMGLQVFFMVWMGLIGLAIVGKVRVRSIAAGAFFIGMYALLRYGAIALWDYNQGGMPDTYWSNTIFAWTAWPVALLLQGMTTWKMPAIPSVAHGVAPPGSRRLVLAIVTITLGVFAWTAYEGYFPAGVKKQGRMLIDEFHSDWEWTEMPFDTVWYGQQSTYNFYLLADFWKHYYDVTRHFDSLTPQLLANYDILLLKVPTQPYSPKEVDAIYNWVQEGGGLILIGEHTNVFGYATFLNPIASRFGMRYIADIVYELKTGDLNLEHTPKILPHPIRQNMPPDFLFGGPCSIWADLSARSIITGMELKTLPADYTQRNFFPERSGHTGYRFGLFLLSLSLRCGKGRIVAFPDSTLWSNFFMFIPGKPELALGLADYVNRFDPFPYWRVLTILFAAVALLFGAVAAASLGVEGWIWMAAVGCLVFGGSARLFEAINRHNYVLPKPHTPIAQLNFESTHSQFFVPELRLAREADKDFSTFYLWASRVGVVPRKFPTLQDALAQPGGQILIDPGTPFTAEELSALRDFVSHGGTLYVFDDPANRQSTSASVMAQFGLSFDMRPISAPAKLMPDMTSDVQAVLWQGSGRVIGGEPLLTASDSSVSCAHIKFGEGQVIAFGNSHVFERKTMGYTAMIPNPVQNAISQWEYRLMGQLNYPPAQAQTDNAAPAKTP
ncbi:MAG: hypothetical protein HY304_03805 [candidate division Zixibacteria bacterium]|nr:hypothetical protein [candidate division Zixibacteria bacterium]